MDFEGKDLTEDRVLCVSPCNHGMKLHQINADECTHTLLKHHFISTLYHSDMLQPSKGYPQGVRMLHYSSKVNKMSHQM